MLDDQRSLNDALFFFLMIRRPPRSTLDRSSAASDVYKRQLQKLLIYQSEILDYLGYDDNYLFPQNKNLIDSIPVSYTHLRAHETVLDLVCRLLLEKKTLSISIVLMYYTYMYNR